ncbi:glycerophosphodiester phosphodiesterase [Acidobacteria bacterium AH-259-O06]|nr:glycerophosphodiester phosphodiesterase [Acidobacteria bacterium AH-259-O06]
MEKLKLRGMARSVAAIASSLVVLFVTHFLSIEAFAQYTKKTVVAHRGASAYAPEHTLEAYRLAIEQGADYVEEDLQITKDGVLVCLHDLTLERTTNVEEVFPHRYRQVERHGVTEKHWFIFDFTLEEVKQLDAGSWFDKRFAGAQIPTWQEAIQEIRGKAGLFPETKAPEVYGRHGFDMERLILAELEKNGLHQPGADPDTPVIIQSFSAESLRKMAFELKTRLPLVLLLGEGNKEWASPEGLKKVKEFAVGIGPAKSILRASPRLVEWAHNTGLSVTPYTFRSSAVGKGFWKVRAEMAYYLDTLDVEALFTDNPDQFPHK